MDFNINKEEIVKELKDKIETLEEQIKELKHLLFRLQEPDMINYKKNKIDNCGKYQEPIRKKEVTIPHFETKAQKLNKEVLRMIGKL